MKFNASTPEAAQATIEDVYEQLHLLHEGSTN